MYLIENIDQIRHLHNEPKKLIVFYNKDRRKVHNNFPDFFTQEIMVSQYMSYLICIESAH